MHRLDCGVVVPKLPWHNLFIHTFCAVPRPRKLEGFVPELTIRQLPHASKADPRRHLPQSTTVIALNFERKNES